VIRPVYAVSFNVDQKMLLSGSEDGALRLLSLQTWTCLVTYKGHVFPVCVVKLSPLGYYLALTDDQEDGQIIKFDYCGVLCASFDSMRIASTYCR